MKGWVVLDGLLHTKLVCHLQTETVTHPSSNRTRYRATSLIETNVLTTNPAYHVCVSMSACLSMYRCSSGKHWCWSRWIHVLKSHGTFWQVSRSKSQLPCIKYVETVCWHYELEKQYCLILSNYFYNFTFCILHVYPTCTNLCSIVILFCVFA